MAKLNFSYTYANLPEAFYEKRGATSFSDVRLLQWNNNLSEILNISAKDFSSDELARIFSGLKLQDGAQPVAMAYSGHQFGHFNPYLGDGRALLLGEMHTRDGKSVDVHLKGSGRTAFSRRGDGLANQAAVIREYIMGEALQGLGIPCSRALALIQTNEMVYREDAQPSCVLVRIASSHIRIGTFEYFIARKQPEQARRLADFVIDRHHPDLPKSVEGYLELFDRICDTQAQLISQWLGFGFVHGVMNTDNTFVSGETLDFGPCAFLEDYDPEAVFSSIDKNGRYAYLRQPEIMHWNLSVLASCFLHFVSENDPEVMSLLERSLSNYSSKFEKYYRSLFSQKIGFPEATAESFRLVETFLNLLQRNKMDMTNGFRDLAAVATHARTTDDKTVLLSEPFWALPEVQQWLKAWKMALEIPNHSWPQTIQMMNTKNPARIPRNHRVEQCIQAVVKESDWTLFHKLLAALAQPFKEDSRFQEYRNPAQPGEKVLATFCNT